MARLPRLDMPGVPQHVIQRGNNRTTCFFNPADYTFYLASLGEAAQKAHCAVHAYVLMTNHVHLLVTAEVPGGLSLMMQSLGRRYVRYINRLYNRTGTLWEGRFKSSLVESERYFLTCARYIELNPVRAAMVQNPADYPWSSYTAHAYGGGEPWLVHHACYTHLGPNARGRQAAYRALFQDAITPETLTAIRRSLNRSGVLGSPQFQESIEAQLARRVRPGKPGRPKRGFRRGEAGQQM